MLHTRTYKHTNGKSYNVNILMSLCLNIHTKTPIHKAIQIQTVTQTIWLC